VITELGRWAARSPFKPAGALNVDSLILSFRTMFNAPAAEGLSATIELRIGEHHFHARVARGRMELVRGGADDADATIEGDSDALTNVAYGGRKFADAMRSGDLKVAGDKSLAKRFLTLFQLPERAPAASLHRIEKSRTR
jgi:ubiquinone biosynthesis protein UbiJ